MEDHLREAIVGVAMLARAAGGVAGLERNHAANGIPAAAALPVAQHEHGQTMQHQTQAPAQRRDDGPLPVPQSHVRCGKQRGVDQQVHRCMYIPAQLGASAPTCEAVDFFG